MFQPIRFVAERLRFGRGPTDLQATGRSRPLANVHTRRSPQPRPLRHLGLTAAAALLGSGLLASSFPAAPVSQAANGSGGLYVFGARGGVALTSPSSAGTNPLFSWAELEPTDGAFNWAPMDTALADARNAGKRALVRVYTNQDGFGQATPNWFFGLPGAQSYYPTAWARSLGYRAPVAWDPVYQQRFGRLVQALGQRYNGNTTIDVLQTNAGSGVYGEMILSVENLMPPGYSLTTFAATVRYWTDQWLAAFPNTRLALMVNSLGYNLGEDAAAYAASKGVAVEQNSPWLGSASVALFGNNAGKTATVLEAEDAGCQSATGAAFDRMISNVFSWGVPLDYMTLCAASFSDGSTAAKLPSVISRLRQSAPAMPSGSTAPTPAPTPPPATATPAQATNSGASGPWVDNFDGYLLPGWTLSDPMGNTGFSATSVAGHATFTVPAGSSHDCWGATANCPRLLRPVVNTDGTFETKLDDLALTTGAQTAGLLLWQDSSTYLRFEFWSDGSGVYPAAWRTIGGVGSGTLKGPKVTLGSANLLRVKRVGSTFTLDYSTNGGSTWATAGSFSQPLTLTQAGVHAINGGSNPATTARFDYVNISGQAVTTDGFNGALNNGWAVNDPLGNSSLSLTAVPGHATLAVPAGSSHDCWGTAANCARLVRAAANKDGVWETKIDNLSLGVSAQTAGILLWQDSVNYLRFEFWSDGSGVYPAAWSVSGGASSGMVRGPSVALGGANLLRVRRAANTFALDYSTNGGGSWTTAGSFTQAITLKQAGLHVINAGSNPATAARFDYFTSVQ